MRYVHPTIVTHSLERMVAVNSDFALSPVNYYKHRSCTKI